MESRVICTIENKTRIVSPISVLPRTSVELHKQLYKSDTTNICRDGVSRDLNAMMTTQTPQTKLLC
jgi:hypothetical protein